MRFIIFLSLATSCLLFALTGCEKEPVCGFGGGCMVPTCEGTTVTAKDMTGFDGCGIVLVLEDGSKLEPTNLNELEFELTDGMQLCIDYEEQTEMASICMVGRLVKILNAYPY